MVQLLSISIYSEPLLRLIERKGEISPRIFKFFIFPLAIGKFMASVTSHVSLWTVPVSYAHTVKATMPLFTVILTRVLFGERQTTSIYLSLVPIITGVIIATATEFQFEMVGLISALLSCGIFSLQNIFSKKVLKMTGIHQFQLLATLGRLSLALFFPFWFLIDGRRLWMSHGELHDPVTVSTLLFIDGLLNFFQNLLAFTVLKLVTPLTYSIANASKRIAIIGVSLVLLRNPVSVMNIIGMLLAVLGVLMYNRAKHLEGRHEPLLPTKTVKNDSNFNYLNGKTNTVI
jgi:solute carrier family 35 protein E1